MIKEAAIHCRALISKAKGQRPKCVAKEEPRIDGEMGSHEVRNKAEKLEHAMEFSPARQCPHEKEKMTNEVATFELVLDEKFWPFLSEFDDIFNNQSTYMNGDYERKLEEAQNRMEAVLGKYDAEWTRAFCEATKSIMDFAKTSEARDEQQHV